MRARRSTKAASHAGQEIRRRIRRREPSGSCGVRAKRSVRGGARGGSSRGPVGWTAGKKDKSPRGGGLVHGGAGRSRSSRRQPRIEMRASRRTGRGQTGGWGGTGSGEKGAAIMGRERNSRMKERDEDETIRSTDGRAVKAGRSRKAPGGAGESPAEEEEERRGDGNGADAEAGCAIVPGRDARTARGVPESDAEGLERHPKEKAGRPDRTRRASGQGRGSRSRIRTEGREIKGGRSQRSGCEERAETRRARQEP